MQKIKDSSTQSPPLDLLRLAFAPDPGSVPLAVCQNAAMPGTESRETTPVHQTLLLTTEDS